MGFKWYSKVAVSGHQDTSAGWLLMADWGNTDALFYVGHCYEEEKRS